MTRPSDFRKRPKLEGKSPLHLTLARERFNSRAYTYECDVCETSVTESAKHCGACNRCTEGFDHHCRWLNNCVGKANYKNFFRLIVATMVMSVDHTVTNAFVLDKLYRADLGVEEIHRSAFGRLPWPEFKIILLIACVLNLSFAIFLIHLTWFHWMLQRNGLTTYEYIRQKEQRAASKIVKKKQIPKTQLKPAAQVEIK